MVTVITGLVLLISNLATTVPLLLPLPQATAGEPLNPVLALSMPTPTETLPLMVVEARPSEANVAADTEMGATRQLVGQETDNGVTASISRALRT